MKSKLASLLGLACALALFAGCVAPMAQIQTQATATPFDAAAFEPYRAPGKCKLIGQAFLKTRGGDVKVAAGEIVGLLPGTAYLKEVRALRDKGIEPIGQTREVAAEIEKAIRKTVADGQGNFEFTDLPAGNYLLEVNIQWLAGSFMTGGLVTKTVTVSEGGNARVMLTR